MKIGLLVPSIYAAGEAFHHRISAPIELSLSLADGLVEAGVDVTFFSAADIPTKAKIVSIDKELLDPALHLDYQQDLPSNVFDAVSLYERKKYYELSISALAYEYGQKKKVDLIHIYHALGNLGHYFAELTDIPTLCTLHPFPPHENTLERWRYARFVNQKYIAISQSQKKGFHAFAPKMDITDVIYHGIDIDQYAFSSKTEDYFVFLGRLAPEKGLDVALEVCGRLGIPLRIATDLNPIVEKSAYFKNKVGYHLNNPLFSLTGFLVGNEKVALLQKAKALLFPLQWEEPFGMVMIEAMSCGTPVVAFSRGSVPEVVIDGETGFLVDPYEGYAGIEKAVQKLRALSSDDYLHMRKRARAHVEKHFTRKIMTEHYMHAYRNLLNE